MICVYVKYISVLLDDRKTSSWDSMCVSFWSTKILERGNFNTYLRQNSFAKQCGLPFCFVFSILTKWVTTGPLLLLLFFLSSTTHHFMEKKKWGSVSCFGIETTKVCDDGLKPFPVSLTGVSARLLSLIWKDVRGDWNHKGMFYQRTFKMKTL